MEAYSSIDCGHPFDATYTSDVCDSSNQVICSVGLIERLSWSESERTDGQ